MLLEKIKIQTNLILVKTEDGINEWYETKLSTDSPTERAWHDKGPFLQIDA